MYQGTATCTVYDDLTKHAIGYREMCLHGESSEFGMLGVVLQYRGSRQRCVAALQGDVFYLHARLLERGSHLGSNSGMTPLGVGQ